MTTLICPVCGRGLEATETRYCCVGGHSFDRARQGYVNLLQSQRSSARTHGDDKGMVAARQRFLETGGYEPLRAELVRAVQVHAPKVLVDAGCGECWYTAAVADALPDCQVFGFDISKDALKWASRRAPRAVLAVSSCFALPLVDGAADGLMNIFSPLAEAEYARVLRPGGRLFRIVPGEEHLWELKAAVYDTPLPNRPEREELKGFRLTERLPVDFTLTLKNTGELEALFQMTPYYYRTGAEGVARLARLESLTTRASFRLLIYERQEEGE